MSDRAVPASAARRRLPAIIAVGVAGLMLGLSFAAVPLYRMFCAMTGYGGTTRRVEHLAVAYRALTTGHRDPFRMAFRRHLQRHQHVHRFSPTTAGPSPA